MNPATTKSDPWELAKARFLDELDPTERQLFENATLENIYYSTSNINRSDAEDSRTRFVVRKLGPLVSAIEGYGKALDTFAQIAPLYLAPIWGAIRVVLVVARAHGKFFEKVSEVLERIGDVLPRFRDYERIYDQGKHPQLTQALSNAYLESSSPEFDSTIERFRRHRDNVRDVASHIHLIEAAEHRNAELILLAEDRKRKLLSKLSGLECAHRHHKLKSARHEGTGLWLIIHPEYTEWQTSARKSSVLCCHGIPGCGKSVLVSSIIDHLDTNNSVIYYYCDYSDKRTLEPANVWGTLARQTLERQDTVPDTLATQIDEAEHDGERLSEQSKALQILKCAMQLCSGPIYIIFDGIDEASEASQMLICHGFKELLTTISIRLVITGREEMGYLLRPGPAIPFLKIPVSQSAIGVDIENFVRASTRRLINDCSLVLQDPSLEELIVKKLVEGAQGMFLWVEFQLHDLCEPESDHGIKLVLENLPRSLSETYDRLLSKIEGIERRDMIARMFKWIVCARQPLSVDQLREGIAFTLADLEWDSEKIPTQFSRLVRACGNLVIVDEESHDVQLAHYTVQQYLLSQESSPFYFTLKQANIMAGETCVAYLNFTNFDSQIVLYKENTNTDVALLKKFASSRTLVSPDNPGQKVVQVWNALRSSGRGVVDFNMASHPRQAKSKHHELSKFELLPYVTAHWLWHTIDFDSQAVSGITQLGRLDRRAQLFGDLIMTKDLLFDFRPWKSFNIPEEHKMARQQLLGWALVNNHSYLVQSACDLNPFDIEISFRWVRESDSSVPTNKDVAKRVLCNLGIVELETPSNLCVSDSKWLYERVCYACRKGHVDVIKACQPHYFFSSYLMDRLLIIAAGSGQLEMANLFLSIRTKPTASLPFIGLSFNALEFALLFGHTQVAEYLMLYDFEAAFSNLDHYFNVLDNSIQENYVKIVDSLFLIPDCLSTTTYKFKAKSNPTREQLVSDRRMSGFLVQVIRQRNHSVLEILLRNGVSPNVANDEGSIPLLEAIESCNEYAVELLIRSGCKLGNTPQGLPLTFAASLGHLRIAELLVEGGAEVFGGTFADENATTLIHLLTIERSFNLILSPTPLYIATCLGHIDIAEMLIRNGAAVDFPSINSSTEFKLCDGDLTARRWSNDTRYRSHTYETPSNSLGWVYPLAAAIRRRSWDMVKLFLNSNSAVASMVSSTLPHGLQNFPDFMVLPNRLVLDGSAPDGLEGATIEKTIFTTIAKTLVEDVESTYPQLEILIAAGAHHDELCVQARSLFLWASNNDKLRLRAMILAKHPNPDDLRLRTLGEAIKTIHNDSRAFPKLLSLEAEMMTGTGHERFAQLKDVLSSVLRRSVNRIRLSCIQVALKLARADAPSNEIGQQHRSSIAVLTILASDLKPLPLEIRWDLLNLLFDIRSSLRDLLSKLDLLEPAVAAIRTLLDESHFDLDSAICFGNEFEVWQLCMKGALIDNTRQLNGTSPLIYAVEQGVSVRIIDNLIDFGAQIEALDDLNESALHKAIRKNEPNVLDVVDCLLFSRGIPVSEGYLEQVLNFCVESHKKVIWMYITKRNLENKSAKNQLVNQVRFLEPFRMLRQTADLATSSVTQEEFLRSSWTSKQAAHLLIGQDHQKDVKAAPPPPSSS